MGRFRASVITGLVLLGPLLGAGPVSAATKPPPLVSDRDADPVVVTGAAVPALIGAQPGRVVAFRRQASGWKQVPVQVDERAVVDYAAVRHRADRPFSHLAYTDPGTFAGADPDPALDADDEIALMARDGGVHAAPGVADPVGVAPSSPRVILVVRDPLRPAARSYLYLFRGGRSLDPSAGRPDVDYHFALRSGAYPGTYDFKGIADDGNGPPDNVENSTVRTAFYRQHLLSRWIEDELHVTAGDASGVDILDGDKVQVSSGCGRSEVTFSRGGGGFIANRTGPIRAIRSYVGANSGTYTQRDDVFYDRASVTTTFLRVHPGIAKISLFEDYSAAAIGMTYRNSVNPLGVTIDGMPDTVLPGAPRWEQVSGPQGAVSIVTRIKTDLPQFAATNFYLDQATDPTTVQCGGYADKAAIGSSGTAVSSSGANTDPTLGSAAVLTGTRTTFYDAPQTPGSVAARRAQQVDAPLRVSVVTRPKG